ncbi:MAG: hypothetical protein JWQ66_1285 [Mucilaginibacter sp.]|nr:hypothetical protein [Mucilaginibacter sp.]
MKLRTFTLTFLLFTGLSSCYKDVYLATTTANSKLRKYNNILFKQNDSLVLSNQLFANQISALNKSNIQTLHHIDSLKRENAKISN